MQTFQQRVNGYMELRRQAAKEVPPLQMSSDWRAIEAASDALAHALRAARVHARRGDVFTAEAAGVIRQRIADAIHEHGLGADALLDDRAGDSAHTAPMRVAVNARFDWTRAAATPGYIIAALPPLPDELQYRFVNEELILLDCDAGLIVDVLSVGSW